MTIDSQDTLEVALKTDMPFELPPPPFDDPIPIGSETLHGRKTRYIIVKGIDPHQADLFMRSDEQVWRIRNCGSVGVIRINGKQVDGEEILEPGAKLSLGNLDLKLSDDGARLEVVHVTGGVRIQVDRLTRKIGNEKTILNDVSFIAEPAKFIGVLGPSGCGKSSLIQTIAGMVPVSEGTILVNGVPVTEKQKHLEAFQRTCVYLPQNVDNTFHDDLTVREELSVFRQLRMVEDGDAYAVDCNSLTRLGFSPDKIMDTRVRAISGGERRRVAIARALALRPKVMLFDEPTAGLDTVSEREVMGRLHDLAHNGKKTVFCVTHVLTRIMDFDQVLLMRPGGELVFSGTPREALAKIGGTDDPNDWERLYKTLERDSQEGDEIWNRYEPPAKDESGSDDSQLMQDFTSPNPFQRIWGYLKSFGLAFHHRFGVAMLPFVVPMALAFLLWMACRDGYIFGEEQKELKSDCYVFAFCGCLTMFWTGLLGAVGTLVRERVPRRCLERLDGVPLYAYLPAKVIWHAAVCAVQAVIFAGCLAFCVRWGLRPDGLLVGCQLWGKLISPLLICSLSGMFIGMAVSAGFSNETRAAEFVPIFAIAQLLLSRVVVDVESAASSVVARFTDIMPCRWPIDWMSKLLWKDKLEVLGLSEGAASWFALMCWAVGCVMVIALLQWWNERRWHGR